MTSSLRMWTTQNYEKYAKQQKGKYKEMKLPGCGGRGHG